jgi:hypothetical protein
VNVDKTQYMVMSGDQTAGGSQNMRIDNRSFERVEELEYEACPESKDTSLVGRWGNVLCLLWQH